MKLFDISVLKMFLASGNQRKSIHSGSHQKRPSIAGFSARNGMNFQSNQRLEIRKKLNLREQTDSLQSAYLAKTAKMQEK